LLSGSQPAKNLRGLKVTFGNDYDVIDVIEVNSLIPILTELILAVCFRVWHSHCTRASFTVLVSRRGELLTVHSCQNRRQNVFNRGALQFCGGLCVCLGGL